MEDRIIERLREIAGSHNLLISRDELLRYSSDGTKRNALAEAVVLPESTEQVAAVAQLCTEEGVPLTPRGGGTGLSGGALALNGGVGLSLTKMKRVREIVPEDLYVIVEAGMTTEQLHRTAQTAGLFYPPDPASGRYSTIGGDVATSARGLRGPKYGGTRNYLMGLEVVMPTGEVVNTGARTVKSVAGYDLTRLICGSEGTLAIVTAAILKLIPLPEHRVTILAAFKDNEKAAEVPRGVSQAGVIPSALDFMDSAVADAVSKDFALPHDFTGCSLILAETDGFRDAAENEADLIEKVCTDLGAVFTRRTSEPGERERLWEARREVLTSLAELHPVTILEHVHVPRNCVVEMVRSVTEIGKKQGLAIATFGHVSDGNLHPTILVDQLISEKLGKVGKAVSEMSEQALSLGGVLSSEHRIGMRDGGFLRVKIEEEALDVMKRLKVAFDPKGILNPGKLFA